MNTLEACIYCPGQRAKNKAQAKRLKDTPRNRSKEYALWKALGKAKS